LGNGVGGPPPPPPPPCSDIGHRPHHLPLTAFGTARPLPHVPTPACASAFHHLSTRLLPHPRLYMESPNKATARLDHLLRPPNHCQPLGTLSTCRAHPPLSPAAVTSKRRASCRPNQPCPTTLCHVPIKGDRKSFVRAPADPFSPPVTRHHHAIGDSHAHRPPLLVRRSQSSTSVWCTS
jgi:hypothetical protein